MDNFDVGRIHMGLTLLGGILADHGHGVKILDYAFLKLVKRVNKHQVRIPEIEEVIHEFKPDVIGISVFTYVYDKCQTMLDRISHCCDLPIILGGPHFRVFPEDFSDDSRVSYIVGGEAENVILDLIEAAERQSSPVFVESPLPSADDIPEINLDIAYGSQYLKDYQIQLSRGCPYSCTFCNVRYVAGRKIRKREIQTCLDQITVAKRRYPRIKRISITDDCPSFDMERFKEFLRMFKKRDLGCSLWIDNVRANLVDEEMIQLYVAAGGTNICLGVESGHPEVFKDIHKGETLDDIVKAARLVRKYGLRLGGCFVIGLPGDSPERQLYTMRFAKSLGLDYAFWNMVVPWPGTEINGWYQEHGEIGELRDFSSVIDGSADFKEPPASSRDFPKKEMIRAWLMATMEIKNYFGLRNMRKLLLLTVRYRLYRSFFFYLISCFLIKPKNLLFGKLSQGLNRVLKLNIS
jgi:radical SAM superfamily enzyme YgiQ (UPF0313 family)